MSDPRTCTWQRKKASAEKNLSQETKKMKESGGQMKEMWKRKNEIRTEGRGNVTSLRIET